MYTRENRLNNICTHREYYSQFVHDNTKRIVLSRISKNELLNAFKENEHFNSIPLQTWDSIGLSINPDFKMFGDTRNLSGIVCVLKEAAKQILES